MATNDKERPSAQSRSRSQDRADEPASASGLTEVADRAREAVKERLGARIDRSANDLGLLAKTLNLASEQLEGNIAAPYVGKLASQVERLSRFIDEADARRLREDVETLGRKQPLLFIGGALALGIAGGRFLKSSARAGGEHRT